jgi:NADPH2 dehydrogenase
LTSSVEYYEQRACIPGTLIISEAAIIAKNAVGRRNVPGIWSEAQIASWKEITTAIHAMGCAIYCQLWHQGWSGDAQVLKAEGFRVLSSSAVPLSPIHETPNAMTEDEIQKTVQDYVAAAKNAVTAGFDGVEIHGANGYLPDQFLQTPATSGRIAGVEVLRTERASISKSQKPSLPPLVPIERLCVLVLTAILWEY